MNQPIYEMTDEQLKAEYLNTKAKIASLETELDTISAADSDNHHEVGMEIENEQIYIEQLVVEVADRCFNLKPSQ